MPRNDDKPTAFFPASEPRAAAEPEKETRPEGIYGAWDGEHLLWLDIVRGAGTLRTVITREEARVLAALIHAGLGGAYEYDGET
jgi:hypothetical protein